MPKCLGAVLLALLALFSRQRPQLTFTALPLTPTNTLTIPAPAATPAQTVIPAAAPTTAPTDTPIRAPAMATATPSSNPTSAPPTATPRLSLAATATPTVPPSATPALAMRVVVVNAADGLNLRTEASAASSVLRRLEYGARLIAVGYPTASDVQGIAWQNVRTADGQSGWVAAQFVSNARLAAATMASFVPSATASVTLCQAGYVYVTAPRGLNLRAEASVDSPIVVLLAYGRRLQTSGLGIGPDAVGNTWLSVEADVGMIGWVAVQWVSDQRPPTVTPLPAQVTGAVAELLQRTNALRQQNGLSPFVLDEGLSRLALEHSQYMAQHGITHEGSGGMTARQRIIAAGYRGWPTENIYGGNATVDDAWKYWSTDPPHRANLLSPGNTVVGIGVYQTGRLTYYTMEFARPPD